MSSKLEPPIEAPNFLAAAEQFKLEFNSKLFSFKPFSFASIHRNLQKSLRNLQKV